MIESLSIERFWRDPGVDPGWDEYHFLRDPLDHAYANPGVTPVNVDTLTDGFVQLGEPGLGKSVLIDACFRGAKSREGNRLRALHVDLGAIGSEEAFDREVLRAPEVLAWQSGDGMLELFLDGLDECLAGARTMADHLASSIERLPVARLRLRLACRAADWPPRLEERLRELWPTSFAVRVLTPLREKDVRSAVEQAGIAGPDDFLRQARKAGALAARPITLDLMLRIAARDERLPDSRTELYARGCRLLCSEPNRKRRERRRKSPFTERQLFTIGARIAAASILGNRPKIVESLDADTDDEIVTLWDDLIPGVEDVEGETFPVDVPIVEATTATALFRSSGSGAVQWSHRTFGGFLAAYYLYYRRFSLDQKLDLLTVGVERRIAPQLHETAAFLADLDPEFRRAAITFDSEAMLRADVASFPAGDREHLVDALFAADARGDLLVQDLRAEALAKLTHDGLADQLRTRWDTARDRPLAVAIASAVGPAEYVEELVGVAADRSGSFAARRGALTALLTLRDEVDAARLIEQLPHAIGTDVEHQLRGLLLDLLWPASIDADRMFASLVPPSRDQPQWGPYWRFIRDRLPDTTTDEFFAAGLRWLAMREPDYDADRFFEHLSGYVLAGAYARFDKPPFDELLPRTISARHRTWPYSWLRMVWEDEDHERRRRLIEAVVAQVPSEHVPSYRLPFISTKDFSWLSGKLLNAPAEQQRLWASLLWNAFDAEDAAATAFVREHAEHPAIAAAFRSFRHPTEAEEGEMRREAPARATARDGWDGLRKPAAVAHPRWWFGAVNQALVEALTGEKHDWSATAIVQSIRRHVADLDEHAIRDAAERFVRDAVSPTAAELSHGNASSYIYAAACAVILLGDEAGNLGADVWTRWGPALIAAPVFGGIEESELDAVRSLFDDDSMAATILAIANEEMRRQDDSGMTMSIGAARRMWSSPIADGFLELLATRPRPAAYEALLDVLLEHGVAEARGVAEAEVAAAKEEGVVPPHAEAAARCLIERSRDAAWDLVWPIVRDLPPAEGEKVLSRWPGHNVAAFAPKLSPRQITELTALFLERHGSPASESRIKPQQDSANTLLNVLMGNGRVAEVTELRDRFPTIHIGAVVRAKEAFLRAAWRPPSPHDILRLSGDARRRVVHDGPQLLRVIIQLFEALQRDLHGVNPRAKYLWDGKKPKRENDIRDWVRDWLERKRDGLPDIIANKEVEVFAGDYTDIKVQAQPRSPYHDRLPTIDATIEVKGCWHKKVLTAMRDQLLGQYLRGQGYGVYLVAWFGGGEWDEEDRREACHRWTKAEATEFLRRQAAELSSGDVVIESFVLDCSLPS